MDTLITSGIMTPTFWEPVYHVRVPARTPNRHMRRKLRAMVRNTNWQGLAREGISDEHMGALVAKHGRAKSTQSLCIGRGWNVKARW